MKPIQKHNVNGNKLNHRMLPGFTFCVLVLLSAAWQVQGQDAVFSQFYANPIYLNPAFAGSKGCSRLMLNYRNQPFPEFGSFSTYSFSGDMTVDYLSGGMGFTIVHDQQAGLISHTNAGISYAWHGQLTHSWNINLGIQTSYINHQIHTSKLVFPDQYTELGSGYEFVSNASSHNIDFSFGMLVFSNRFYTGFAVHHLNEPQNLVFQDQKLKRKYTIMAGYDIHENDAARTNNISVSPNVIFQSQAGYIRVNYGLYAKHDNLTLGVWFRHNKIHPNTLIFTLGLKQVNYAIGYSYDYSLSGFSTATGGAHEIGVLLNFNCPDIKAKYRILNCPTF